MDGAIGWLRGLELLTPNFAFFHPFAGLVQKTTLVLWQHFDSMLMTTQQTTQDA